MHRSEIEHLKSIRSFPSLVKYLRDELDWPIESDNFDDLTFEYEPEELGIDAKTAVKIKDIKQLRPLVSKQPWGIFFINFEPKQLPIVVLRRILRSLVIKKRASANKSQQATWKLHDLLFISSYGESEHREITFAHFSEPNNRLFGDLPTLKVLGWDDDDTKLKIDHVVHTLSEKMRWPEDEDDAETWRRKWSDAFELRPREVITTSKDLAIRLADLAKSIRLRANLILDIESEKGSLRKMHKAFQTALIHDLNEDGFADMYAQTIAYGLLAARVSRPAGIVADNLADMVPITNPFLKEMLGTFLSIGGRKGKIDFDELGIQEVVDLLNNPDTHMEAILRDFGKRTMQEDPVIHFYELFLKEYDKKKKVERGVFYTPQPVVSYIIRSVHELLQKEFGLKDGLASTITWGEMTKKNPDIKIPEGTSKDEPFVLMLDPATGTATFLVEIIEVIYQTMISRWRKEQYTEFELGDLWNEYVPKHLLPRLFGFELMMAPYAIAHMKIGLKLAETGYKFSSDERAHIYLTNSLEPPSDIAEETAANLYEALGHEAKAVNTVKRSKRFTVVVGNPPYSYMSANLTKENRKLVDCFRYVDGERIKERGAIVLERALQDDYVKFFALAQNLLLKTGCGFISMITNSAYLRNPNMRGMRNAFINKFSYIFLLDLHGDVKRPGIEDKNVFDIKTGVAISLLAIVHTKVKSQCAFAELSGTRESKEKALNSSLLTFNCTNLFIPRPPQYIFDPSLSGSSEYRNWFSVSKIFNISSVGIKTNRDHLVIDFNDKSIEQRLQILMDSSKSIAEVKRILSVRDNAQWTVANGRKACRESYSPKNYEELAYRPFDNRRIYYQHSVVFNPRPAVMRHILGKRNLALITNRRIRTEIHAHFFVVNKICMAEMISSADNCNVYPLWLYNDDLISNHESNANYTPKFIKSLAETLNVKQLEDNVSEVDTFNYIYAIFHSPNYRKRYANFLKADFPRLPLTSSLELFKYLAKLGEELVGVHLMESILLNNYTTQYSGAGDNEIEKVSYSDNTVWIDKNITVGFKGVPGSVWRFQIGGYQVCHKYLKDRKGRTLSKDDINHYHRIVVAINETIRIMAEIDKVIDAHGGWPDAFLTVKDKKEEYKTQPEPALKVAESKPTYKPIK